MGDRRPSRELVHVVLEQAREIAALQAELAERREQVAVLIRQNPFPTWIYCPESLRFLEVNPAAVEAYGWSRREFLGMTIADIRPAEDVPALVANVAKMRDLPEGRTGPWRHRRRDGSLAEVLVAFRTLPFDGRSARLIVAEIAGARPQALHPALAQLSRREREVFARVAHGRTSRDIALELGLSPKSVETYRARFMQKLGLAGRQDLVRYAVEQGILGGGLVG